MGKGKKAKKTQSTPASSSKKDSRDADYEPQDDSGSDLSDHSGADGEGASRLGKRADDAVNGDKPPALDLSLGSAPPPVRVSDSAPGSDDERSGDERVAAISTPSAENNSSAMGRGHAVRIAPRDAAPRAAAHAPSPPAVAGGQQRNVDGQLASLASIVETLARSQLDATRSLQQAAALRGPAAPSVAAVAPPPRPPSPSTQLDATFARCVPSPRETSTLLRSATTALALSTAFSRGCALLSSTRLTSTSSCGATFFASPSLTSTSR